MAQHRAATPWPTAQMGSESSRQGGGLRSWPPAWPLSQHPPQQTSRRPLSPLPGNTRAAASQTACFQLKSQVLVAKKQVRGRKGAAGLFASSGAPGTRHPTALLRSLHRSRLSRHNGHGCHRVAAHLETSLLLTAVGRAPSPPSVPQGLRRQCPRPAERSPWLQASHPEAAWHEPVPTAEVARNNRCLSGGAGDRRPRSH